MLTKSSKYAIRAALYIARNSSKENKIGSKEIAKELEIPAPFLAKTLQELTRKSIITSVKGPKGGFYLTNENKNKTLLEVIDAVGNVNKFEECYLGQLECDDENPCVIHHIYKPFKAKLIDRFQSKSILEIANEKEFDFSKF